MEEPTKETELLLEDDTMAEGGEEEDLDSLRARVREMAEEAEKLKKLQSEVDKNTTHLSEQEKKEIDQRSFRQAVGFLKVGWKHLLLLDEVQRTHEMTVLCALDFFVQQKHRRLGYGKKLFDCMLLHENIQPWEIPVDNPSLSFRHFLRKHYNLAKVIPQLNRFVVFSGFLFPTSGMSQEGNRRSLNESTADIIAPVACPLNFFQEAYQREDSITKSSSWRVLGLDGPSHISNDLSQ